MNDLRVNVNGNSSGFKRTMDEVRTHSNAAISSLGHSWKAGFSGIIGGIAGGFGFTAIQQSFEQFIQRASALRDLSEQLDMSADATQRWQKAVDRLGLSFTGMQTVLTSIQQKRMDALKDPKAAAMFSALGIGRNDVLDLEGVNSSEFAKMVLQAGGQSEGNRSVLNDIVGKRGLKYTKAAELLGQVSVDFDESALSMAHDAEITNRGFWQKIGSGWGGLLLGLKDAWEGVTGQKGSPFRPLPNVGGWLQNTIMNSGPRQVFGDAPTADKSPESFSDPLTLQARRDAIANREKESEAQSRLEDARRKNMTDEQKRASIQKELADQNDKIARGKAYLSEFGDDRAARLKVMEMEAKAETLRAELKRKPMDFTPDALAKVGLFTSSSMSYNPILNVQQQQLAELKGIHRAVQQGGDPFK